MNSPVNWNYVNQEIVGWHVLLSKYCGQAISQTNQITISWDESNHNIIWNWPDDSNEVWTLWCDVIKWQYYLGVHDYSYRKICVYQSCVQEIPAIF